MLSIPKHGFINAHYSILPRWRGRHPIQHAMINGDTQIGVTVHQVDEGIDTGDIYVQLIIPLHVNMEYSYVYNGLHKVATKLLGDTVSMIEHVNIKPTSQPLGIYPPATRRVPEDSNMGSIYLRSLKKTAQIINAMSDPMPNAYLEDTNGNCIYFTGARYEPCN